jgi:hypothetical protein
VRSSPSGSASRYLAGGIKAPVRIVQEKGPLQTGRRTPFLNQDGTNNCES